MPLIKSPQMIAQEVTIGFRCNKCNQSFSAFDGDIWEVQEMFHWEMVGGYGSVWGDENKVEVVLCQNCAYELLSPYAEVKDYRE